MRTFLTLPCVPSDPLPPEFAFDVRSSEALVESLLEEYTREGDIVLDPFAGFGTTLVVAERMGRVPVGLELDPRVAAYARSLLQRPEGLIEGDARRLSCYGLPPFDFSFTSPPFMCRGDREDPLAAYAVPDAGYEAYLRGLQDIYRQVRQLMKPDAHVVLEVANLKQGGQVTTLAWDVAAAIGEVLHFEGEIVVGCDRPCGCGCDHSYCLVFTKGD
jgi:SAM-dependent methyltransferase